VGRGWKPRRVEQYKKLCIPELKKWIHLNHNIPRDIAYRLSSTFSDRDLLRLGLKELVSRSLADAIHVDNMSSMSPDENTDSPITNDIPINNSVSMSEMTDAASDPVAENTETAVVEIYNADEVNLPQCEVDTDSSGDEEGMNYLTSQFSALEMSIPVIRYDTKGNEIDPLTGFPKRSHSLDEVLGFWARNELTVHRASVTRLLTHLHRYKLEISKMDYAHKKLPRKAETLMRLPKSEHKYVIRDFDEYDYSIDDFPAEKNYRNAEDNESSSGNAEDVSGGFGDDQESYVDDEASDIENSIIDTVDGASVNEYNRCIGVFDDDDRNSPEHYDDDIINAMASDEENEVDKDSHKMVYFGLENILTCSNSAGNIQKGPYFNYLRAIALFDDGALTDEVVNRLFPKNSKVLCSKSFPNFRYLCSYN
jgi:hypothetical protein